jgi:micrococcal nuclease
MDFFCYTPFMKKLFMRFVALFILILLSFLVSKFSPVTPPKKDVLSQKVSPTPRTAVSQNEVPVVKVVDGDTITVFLNGKDEKVRILGINTPETVDPRKPVECFGKQASDKAKSILTNQKVRLMSDPAQDNIDKYGRLLRYVYLPDGTDFGLLLIQQGYAYEYTYDTPYKFQTEYKAAQKSAESNELGLWAKNACS